MSLKNEEVDLQAESLSYTKVVSPISLLHTDILLAIFQINADMDRDDENCRAINTTRFSSQVSSLWRGIIIDSPVIWANIIDLLFLHHTGSWWREEVILRTQQSPLYVKGLISFRRIHLYPRPWWLDYLNVVWPRIRKLDLEVRYDTPVGGPMDPTYFNVSVGLSFLSRPAPALESFCMKLESTFDPLKDSPSLLFDNHAPQLRVFRLESAPFSDKCDWLSQLRNLHIYRGDGDILTSVDVLYEILSRMPLLESLYIDDIISSPDISSGRVPIHLPQLRFVQFRSIIPRVIEPEDRQPPERTPIWPLLNHIVPRIGCSFRLVLGLLSSDDIDYSMLVRLAKNYFQFNPPTYLFLESDRHCFTFRTSRKAEFQLLDELFPETPFFDLMIDYTVQGHSPYVEQRISQLYKELFVLSFPQVDELELIVRTAHGEFFTDQKFLQFLSSFTGLKKLVTVPETLLHLYSSTPIDGALTLFPFLDILEITVEETLPSQPPPANSLLASLVPFLQLRRNVGLPISTFKYCSGPNLKYIDGKFHLEDLGSLEAITGLKVIWELKRLIGTGEYICGSGSGETLDFAKAHANARPQARVRVRHFNIVPVP